ncbi:MAG: DUF4403 family protein [Bacteroidota bacterium]
MQPLPTSILNVPIAIDLVDLEELINNQLKGLIYEDNDMEDNGGDKLMAKVEKNGTINVQLEGQEVKYFVPLKIWIKKGIGPTSIEAEGDINLRFFTQFDIGEDWGVSSQTKVEGFEWEKKPVIKLGLFDMPVERIASSILKKSYQRIADRIDQKIQQNFNLRLWVRKAWQLLQHPILLSAEHSFWLRILPKSIQMTPIKNQGEKIHSTLSVSAQLEVKAGVQPSSIALPAMPSYQLTKEAEKDCAVHLKVLVDYEYASQMTQKFAAKRSFGPPGKTVQVDQLTIRPEGDQHLAVDVTTEGAYKGHIEVKARPELQREQGLMVVHPTDFQLIGANIVMRGIGRLLKGVILEQIEEYLRFPLAERLDMVKTQLNQRLESFELASEVLLKGELEELSIQDFHILSEGLQVRVQSQGAINIEVSGFSAVQDKLKPKST